MYKQRRREKQMGKKARKKGKMHLRIEFFYIFLNFHLKHLQHSNHISMHYVRKVENEFQRQLQGHICLNFHRWECARLIDRLNVLIDDYVDDKIIFIAHYVGVETKMWLLMICLCKHLHFVETLCMCNKVTVANDEVVDLRVFL